MSYCSTCKIEWQGNVSYCPDCGRYIGFGCGSMIAGAGGLVIAVCVACTGISQYMPKGKRPEGSDQVIPANSTSGNRGQMPPGNGPGTQGKPGVEPAPPPEA